MPKLMSLPRMNARDGTGEKGRMTRDTPPPSGALTPSGIALMQKVAIRLADEGVPLGAILRSTKLEYDDLRDVLGEACERGHIIMIPREDWPVGQRREDRAPSSIPQILAQDEVIMAIMRTIKATPTQSALLAALLRKPDMTKEGLHNCIQRPDKEPTDQKIVDVLICNLRKKLPEGVKINTLWGYGYGMDKDSRLKMISHLGLTPGLIERAS